MRVQVKYFAAARERAGREEEALVLDEGTTVGRALEILGRERSALSPLFPHLRAAVNQRFVGLEQPLADGDELALIPPVAGGSSLGIVVSDRAPSLDACVAAVRRPGAGAIVAFLGLVRDHSLGRTVERLEYEAYREMAERTFQDLFAEIERELPGVQLALEHRVGALAIGDIAVALAASAPHRAEAFTAARALIDRLKERAPIWKKEFGPDGAVWVGLGP
jgi:molybdopterin converting factor subunit 1